MKRFFENTLISGAYNKALRVVALLCVLLGVSSNAWAGPTWACASVKTWHEGGDKFYYVQDCGFYNAAGNIQNHNFGTVENFGVDIIVLNNDGNNRYSNGEVGYQVDNGNWTTIKLTDNGDYNHGGTKNNQYKAFLDINALNLPSGEHTINFYIRVPHTDDKWYMNNGGANYSFKFNIVGSTPDPDPTPDPEGCSTVYLNDASNLWNKDGARLYVYYWKNDGSNAWKKLKTASSCTNVYYISIPNDVKGYKYVRLNNSNSTPGWDAKWNETGDLSLGTNTEFKLTNADGGGSLQGNNCKEEDTDCESSGGGGEGGGTETAECDYIEVWCKGPSSYVTMNCYAWDNNQNLLLGGWPGTTTSGRGKYNGAEYAVWKFSQLDNISVIFTNSDGTSQTRPDITGLRKGTRYIFEIPNIDGKDWTVNSTAETIDCSLPATNVLLAREAKVDIVAKTATVFGYLKNNPNCDEITDYGFYYCTTSDEGSGCTPVANEDFKWKASSTEILPRGKEFSGDVDKLEDGTTYYYRAYAVIGGETVLSQEVRSITTEPCKAQKAWGDPVIFTVDATFKADNTCKLQFRDVQKAIDYLKGSYVNEYDYQYVSNESGSFNLNQPVVINVRYYDDTPNDPKTAYTYRGTTSVGITAGDVTPVDVNLIQDFNKTATNKANTITIKAGNNIAKPWVHHIVIRNSKNIVLDSLCIYSDPSGLKDNALEIDVNSTDWPRISASFEGANITIQNCMIGASGFTGIHASGYDGITFKGNDIEASFSDNTNRKNILNWGASAKFLACKNIKFIQNNFRGSQPTLLWIQDSENALFMNNVFWNTNTFLKEAENEVTPTAIKLVSQYGKDVNNIGFFYNTFYFQDNGTVGVSSPYNFFTEYLAHANESSASAEKFGSNIYFQYNNCYSYDMDCVGADAFLGEGTGGGTTVEYNIKSESTDNANFCPNNFWSVLDGEGRSTFDFTTGCDITKINVQSQVCETTASGPASLIIKGSDMNLGSAPIIDSTRIKLEADELLADRYLVGVRPSGVGWTYGAYQTREAKDVEKIYWVGVTDKWDDRNNWEFEVKNNDKIVRQRVSCVENLSDKLHVVIEEIGTVEVTGGRSWPKLPASYDKDERYEKSGIPEEEQVNAGSTNKFADFIELEYGAGIIGVEKLINGELHYSGASTKFVSPRSEWILVGPTIKPFDEETVEADDVRDVLSGDYFIKNQEPHVYMHQANLADGAVGWDLTFSDLKTTLTHNKVFAMQIPDEYGDYKLPAELYYAYISPNESMLKDATVNKEYTFTGRFYNEASLPTYEGLKAGESVLLSNTYPANIDANMLNESGKGTVMIYDYEAKSFNTLKEKTSTPILAQHGFVFTPKEDVDLVITEGYFLNTLTKRSAEVLEPYCRINVKNMDTNANSDIEVEIDEFKDDVANYATDAPKIFNTMEASLPDVYVMRYDKKWAGVTIPTMTESIPLGVRISQEDTRIRFSLVDSKDMGDVILEDRLEGKTYNLTIGQTCDVTDLPVGYCEGRFFLNLSEEDIEEEEEDEELDEDVTTEVEETFNDSGISIIGTSNGVVVSCSSDIELQTIYINDMSGKTAAFRVSGQYANIELPVAQGVYTVNVIADKANKTGKVILK